LANVPNLPIAPSLPMNTLYLVAASARAVAFSAIRSGLTPICCDLFGDLDLALACKADTISQSAYARGFVAWSRAAPPGPIAYAGALENFPGAIADLAVGRELWGNSAAVLRAVRSPFNVAACLADAGIACPRVARLAPNPAASWLVKPLASAGGRGIARWRPGQPLPARGRTYFQEMIDGQPCAAVYVADTGRARLLGVTRQLTGEPWLFAAPFQYCGSLGPLALTERTWHQFERLGDALASGFALRGLFGVDCILRDGAPWPVEVNPRYTASVEVLEWGLGVAALDLHRRVFDATAPANCPQAETAGPVVGKAILFARDHLVVPTEMVWTASLDRPPTAWREYADLPNAGQRIAAGQPILTVFASAKTEPDCLRSLQQAAQSLDRLLFAR
jgi:uncharacterized protein